MISTILLLPHAETRERLLAPHAPSCRRRAGQMTFGTITGGSASHTEQYAIKPVKSFDYPVDEHVHLVLARSGAVVPEGVDRLARAERETQAVLGWWSAHDLEVALRNIMAGTAPNPVPPEAFHLGTLLLLDENGEVVGG